jgi:small ligand-binding sensory domain FIST
MNITTSLSFASVAASGENWRDISKKVLEQLESITTDGFKPNIGFLYITDVLADDAASILTLFRSVTEIEHWSGCTALGVCANGAEYVDAPAISVLVGQLPHDQFKFFQTHGPSFTQMHQELEPWLNKHDPMLTFTHANPLSETQPAKVLEEIDSLVGGFMVGGLASSRKEMFVIGREALSSGASGFVFSADVAVATTLSQGCVPMGAHHEVAKHDDHVIAYLDGLRPLDVFTEDLKAMSMKKMGRSPKEIVIGEEIPSESFGNLFRGEANIAFPVAGSDRSDFLVRNIVAIDPDTGMMAVSERLEDGQKIMFVHRDDDSMKMDLSQSLVQLRKRVMHEQGDFKPKGALYVSCVARSGVAFGEGHSPGGEMALIREILGDVPLAGFYASGEISNTRLYGYTGVLTLFL